MNDEKIYIMLSELIKEIDYDLWKSWFLPTHMEEDPEEIFKDCIVPLIKIVKEYQPIDELRQYQKKIKKLQSAYKASHQKLPVQLERAITETIRLVE